MDFNSKEAKRNRTIIFLWILCTILCIIGGFASGITAIQIAAYVLGTAFIWLFSAFCCAFGLMGYVYVSKFHWSNLLMFAVLFIQPAIWTILGVLIFS